ncbi:bifunctional Ribose 5-phosphate isomerase [Babesia duncani]|uniref:ribose-5-phosphate isomerase n=1 Tax=Babesia duncani TaxID=323732 RepID=A0AAD9UNM6_9APIC|nr:bifunctional Ribose 5-phosphate isomerase [Babesia duncani]
MDFQSLIENAAAKAVESNIASDSLVGLGTGRSANAATRYIAQLLKEGKIQNVTGVPTSNVTQVLANDLDIKIASLGACNFINVAFDGADAVDDKLNLIKGRGGALYREKLIEQKAQKLIIIVDESKLAGERHIFDVCPVPIEIVDFGHELVVEHICDRLHQWIRTHKIRRDDSGSNYKTDNGNVILDVVFNPCNINSVDKILSEQWIRDGIRRLCHTVPSIMATGTLWMSLRFHLQIQMS